MNAVAVATTAIAMIGEVPSSTLRGSIVHHGNRGRSTSNGAGSTHREHSTGRITEHPHHMPHRPRRAGRVGLALVSPFVKYPGLAHHARRVLSFSLFTP